MLGSSKSLLAAICICLVIYTANAGLPQSKNVDALGQVQAAPTKNAASGGVGSAMWRKLHGAYTGVASVPGKIVRYGTEKFMQGVESGLRKMFVENNQNDPEQQMHFNGNLWNAEKESKEEWMERLRTKLGEKALEIEEQFNALSKLENADEVQKALAKHLEQMNNTMEKNSPTDYNELEDTANIYEYELYQSVLQNMLMEKEQKMHEERMEKMRAEKEQQKIRDEMLKEQQKQKGKEESKEADIETVPEKAADAVAPAVVEAEEKVEKEEEEKEEVKV